MRRFVYTPDVQAYIKTDSGIIDVSADIIDGSVTRRRDAASSASLTLQNPHRKYIRKFRPMDRIVIYLTRVKPMLVFSGYLDTVPVDQLYPGPVELSASCTIKRILHTYWDPSLAYVQAFFLQHGWVFDSATGSIFSTQGKGVYDLDINSGIGEMIRTVLHEVGGWPITNQGESGRNTVHVLKLPENFLSRTTKLINKQIAANEEQESAVKDLLTKLLTVDGLYTAPFVNDEVGAIAGSGISDARPLPKALATEYTAKIYGKPVVSGSGSYVLNPGLTMPNDQWIKDVLSRVQAPYSLENAIFLSDWQRWEGGHTDNDATWNWLNSTQGSQFPTINSVGVRAYSDYTTGVQYTAATITNGHYPDIVAALRSGNPYGTPPFTGLQIWLSGPNAIGTPASIDYFNKVMTTHATKASDVSVGKPTTPDGKMGDVRVGSEHFFKEPVDGAPNQKVGYTFKIRGNPYGDDNIIFKATSVDPKLKTDEISIYIPSNAANAQGWHNKKVQLETSVNLPERFQAKDTTTSSGTQTNTVQVIQIARQELSKGVKESPMGSNSGTDVLKYLNFVGTGAGVPWCAAFAMWCYGQTNHPPGLKTASCDAVLAYGQAHNLIVQTPAPGDAVIFNWNEDQKTDHIGIVESVNKDGSFETIEGNSSDAVSARHRTRTNVTAFVRFPNQSDTSAVSEVSPYNPTGVGTSISAIPTAEQIAQIAASTSLGLPLVFPQMTNNFESEWLRGERSLQNDVPLMEFIQFLAKASGRSFMSMPNGDIVFFYPDYFNWSGQTPYFRIADIEIMDLNISLSDDPLTTHVFTTADTFTDSIIDLNEQMSSTVASVESINTFGELVNVEANFDSDKFLNRYGARPFHQEVSDIKNSVMQFMVGWTTFLQKWASTFQCSPTFTFMPEIYPGTLIEFDSKDLLMFVEEVTHNFSREGGFTTSASLSSPSTIAKQFNYGMVLSNGYDHAVTAPKTANKARA